jgi:hypothetical protein
MPRADARVRRHRRHGQLTCHKVEDVREIVAQAGAELHNDHNDREKGRVAR